MKKAIVKFLVGIFDQKQSNSTPSAFLQRIPSLSTVSSSTTAEEQRLFHVFVPSSRARVFLKKNRYNFARNPNAAHRITTLSQGELLLATF